MHSVPEEGAIRPSGETLLDRTLPEYGAGDYYFDGRFYQTVDEAEYQRRQTVIDQHIAAGALPNLETAAYQQWVELDWKVPHGTYAAAARWASKLKEEASKEAPDALGEHSELDTPAARQAAVEELGDVLWVICAAASNAGQSVDHALQIYLWGNGKLSNRQKPLTLSHIDQYIAEGLTPWMTPADARVAEDDPLELVKMDEMEPWRNLTFRGVSLALACEKQFAYGDTEFSVSQHAMIGEQEVAPMVADQIVLIAWYAKHFVSSNLAELAAVNIDKLRNRVATNTVDKSDGPRQGNH